MLTTCTTIISDGTVQTEAVLQMEANMTAMFLKKHMSGSHLTGWPRTGTSRMRFIHGAHGHHGETA